MRETPLPLLRDLPPMCTVVRCQRCRELVLAEEACASADEAWYCVGPQRFDELNVDRHERAPSRHSA